LEESIKSYKL